MKKILFPFIYLTPFLLFGQNQVKPNGSAQSATQNAAVTYDPLLDYGYGFGKAPIVTIGNQHWLGKNLNVDRFANGDPIPQAQTAEEWENAYRKKKSAWCYYNNDPANGHTYGKFYNWYAVMDPRKLAPKGWHVPSENEWVQLTHHLGGEEIAGAKMKSTNRWENNGNGSNSSNISCLPGGYRNAAGTFINIGRTGDWWSSSESGADKAWTRALFWGSDLVYKHNYFKGYGFSVRCVKEDL